MRLYFARTLAGCSLFLLVLFAWPDDSVFVVEWFWRIPILGSILWQKENLGCFQPLPLKGTTSTCLAANTKTSKGVSTTSNTFTVSNTFPMSVPIKDFYLWSRFEILHSRTNHCMAGRIIEQWLHWGNSSGFPAPRSSGILWASIGLGRLLQMCLKEGGIKSKPHLLWNRQNMLVRGNCKDFS